ncbi:MAG: uroporphyrinogen-III synthase [Bryobacteraceae bacterium]
MSFLKARVLCFESRREKEIAELVRINGGQPFVAPALREIPIDQNSEAFAFADRLYRGEFDMVIFLTGVGARYLQKVLATRDGEERLPAALRKLSVAVRGPKPMAVMKEWSVPVAVQVPEPNTYRELLEALRDRPEHSVALQEYGRTNHALVEGLQAQGRTVASVPVYQWSLPLDTEPLVRSVEGLCAGDFDVAIFTTGVQLDHLLQLADERGKRNQVIDSLRKMFLASIGPTCTETMQSNGLTPDLEPSHPKMGILVREAAIEYERRRSQPDTGPRDGSNEVQANHV